MCKKMRTKGFALGMTLILGLAILIMGFAGMIMSEMGFRSISAEARWHMVEKAANYGLLTTIDEVRGNYSRCGAVRNFTINSATVEVRSVRTTNACFLWSKATLGGARQVKAATVYFKSTDLNLAALVIKRVTNIDVNGSASIVNCDIDCKVPAIIYGIDTNGTIPRSGSTVSTCPNNPNGIVSVGDPPIRGESMLNVDLTSRVFYQNNRTELLQAFTSQFRVAFNDGEPVGISNIANSTIISSTITDGTFDVCNIDLNNCEASRSTITCSENSKISITWDGTRYSITNKDQPNIRTICTNLNFGDKNLTIGTFTGGGIIVANQIKLGSSNNDKITGVGNLTLIAKNEVVDNANNLEINNVNIFAKNIRIDNSGFKLKNGIIYSGGLGGNMDLNVNSNTKLGTQDSPILIISDNMLNINRNGDAEINALIFTTDRSTKLNISGSQGNFNIRGAIVSNSLSTNDISISGDFNIAFSKAVIETLSRKFAFLVRPPLCSNQLIMQTKYLYLFIMSTY